MSRLKLAITNSTVVTAAAIVCVSAVAQSAPISLVAVDDNGVTIASQKEFSRLLGERGIASRPLVELGNALASRKAATSERVSQTAAVLTRLASLEELFHGQQTAEANVAIAGIDDLIATDPRIPRELRVRSELWRAALALSANDRHAAHGAVRLALIIDPKLVVDLNMFFPSLASLVESERSRVTPVKVRVIGAPPTATVWLDGDRVDERAEVGIGLHVVHATAAGFSKRSERIEVGTDGVIEVELELALEIDLAKVLATQTTTTSEKLRRACRALGPNDCVFVAALSKLPMRAAVIHQVDGRIELQSFLAGGLDIVAEWIANTVALASKPAPTKASLSAHFGLVPFATRSFEVDWDGRTVERVDEGGGFLVGLGWRERWLESTLFARVDINILRLFEGRVSSENLGTPVPSRAGTGWWFEGQLRGGYQHWFYGGRLAVAPQLTLSLIDQRVRDVEDELGEIGLFSSATQLVIAPTVGVLARPTPTLIASADIGLGVIGLFLKEPNGLGSPGDPATVLLNVGGRWLFAEKWELDLVLSFTLIAIEATGTASSRVDPPPQDANLGSAIGRGFAILARRF